MMDNNIAARIVCYVSHRAMSQALLRHGRRVQQSLQAPLATIVPARPPTPWSAKGVGQASANVVVDREHSMLPLSSSGATTAC
jgi:hypothetical protein